MNMVPQESVENLDEYTALVRYVSTYRDPRAEVQRRRTTTLSSRSLGTLSGEVAKRAARMTVPSLSLRSGLLVTSCTA